MSNMAMYPKRLIEVDLPIKRISAHARREKSIRHGHISTLHIWWARRPLAACRAVLCAALWPDPADPLCPDAFRKTVREWMRKWATAHLALLSHESMARFVSFQKGPAKLDNNEELRYALLDFVADFANWDNSTRREYLETSRALTQAAHEALGGMPDTKPLVVDPFAGGGSIPLEALRIGAYAFASDLNPVAVLLNKVVLEYIPKYGQRLADEVRKWGAWIKQEAEKELAEFYPKDPDGATPIAYLWARTIICEGPGCGAEVPLMRSLWLAKRGSRSVALHLIPDRTNKRVDFGIVESAKVRDISEGTVRRGSATCLVCGYTTPVESVREQLKKRRGGTADARLFCVATIRPGEQGRFYRLPTKYDREAVNKTAAELEQRRQEHKSVLSLVPDEALDIRGIRHTWAMIYGLERWCDFFTSRQALALITLARLTHEVGKKLSEEHENDLTKAIRTCLALVLDRQVNALTSLSRWNSAGEKIEGVFSRQAIGMVWDFAEANPFSGATGDWEGAVEWVEKVCATGATAHSAAGHAEPASATVHPLPDDAANAFITDPPYYDAVPYAHLSDFFYVWLHRSIAHVHPDLFLDVLVPKDDEIVVDRPHALSNSTHDMAFYERELTKAFANGCRILRPDGIGTIVFASKTTASWEALLQAVVDAGWIITGSWPIDTEMESRVAAQGQARLASSIHLVCRPRKAPDGSALMENIGDWREVLAELPKRIHDWMPRLAQEGIVGADAIFACLGPALEIFSRYSSVEKASGEKITLKEYLEYVWAAVGQEALSMIFEGADATGFEADARLTAIWFWVLKAAVNGTSSASDSNNSEESDESTEEEPPAARKKTPGYTMEYDAARKLAQGLGADLHALSRPGGIITIQGNVATLNSIVSRERYLLGQQLSLFGGGSTVHTGRTRGIERPGSVTMRPVHDRQGYLFAEETPIQIDLSQPFLPSFQPTDDARPAMERLIERGETVLDRLHQAMLLFGRAQVALLGPFLQETRMGNNPRFWRLAQALSALYPTGADEKRWIDGVLGRKRGLGF